VKLDVFECLLFKVYKMLCTNKNMKLYLMKTLFDLTSDVPVTYSYSRCKRMSLF